MKRGAREVAAEVLGRVDADDAYAAAALSKALGSEGDLSDADRALATALVYGVLRVRPWLWTRLGAYLKNPAKLDSYTKSHLELGAYQLWAMSKIPAFAAVNEAVRLVRKKRGDGMASLTNAVLRKVSANRPEADEVAAAFVKGVPAWVRDALVRAIGDEAADAYLRDACQAPPICLRVRPGHDVEQVQRHIAGAFPDARIEPGVLPGALRVWAAGDPNAWPGATQRWVVQEEGSQWIAALLGATAGERVLDACAGRGNKSLAVADAMGTARGLVCVDAYPNKLERLAQQFEEWGHERPGTEAVDWTLGDGGLEPSFDRILVDAPCTGLGTLRRRPDLISRRRPESLAELAETQKQVLKRVLPLLKPGGTLVYAVCSVTREEGEDAIQSVLSAFPDVKLHPFDFAGLSAPEGFARLLPTRHGTDGYFVARMTRKMV